MKIFVQAYRKEDGTYVDSHWREVKRGELSKSKTAKGYKVRKDTESGHIEIQAIRVSPKSTAFKFIVTQRVKLPDGTFATRIKDNTVDINKWDAVLEDVKKRFK